MIPFAVDGWDPRLVAAVLGHEHGVGVRSGCFCAQPYVHHLLGLGRDDIDRWVHAARRQDLRAAPGLVRISLGCYNDRDDVDRAIDGLESIIAGEVRATYRQQADGSFHPIGFPTGAGSRTLATISSGPRLHPLDRLLEVFEAHRWAIAASNILAAALFVAGCLGFFWPDLYAMSVTLFLAGSLLFLFSALAGTLVQHGSSP